MPFSPKSIEEKPYNACIICGHIGKHCDGPNFLAMRIQRICEWCRLRKEYLHSQDPKWTNAHVAELAQLSKISVDRFLAGAVEDIKLSTLTRIVRVLVTKAEVTAGSWGKYPCAMAVLSDEELALGE